MNLDGFDSQSWWTLPLAGKSYSFSFSGLNRSSDPLTSFRDFPNTNHQWDPAVEMCYRQDPNDCQHIQQHWWFGWWCSTIVFSMVFSHFRVLVFICFFTLGERSLQKPSTVIPGRRQCRASGERNSRLLAVKWASWWGTISSPKASIKKYKRKPYAIIMSSDGDSYTCLWGHILQF